MRFMGVGRDGSADPLNPTSWGGLCGFPTAPSDSRVIDPSGASWGLSGRRPKNMAIFARASPRRPDILRIHAQRSEACNGPENQKMCELGGGGLAVHGTGVMVSTAIFVIGHAPPRLSQPGHALIHGSPSHP